jgi:Phosphoserine phosphatase RsbU, N-terminal domain
MSDALARLRLDYRSAFLGYLSQRAETQLRSAYEIGRAAILAGVSLLDLVQIHNAVTLDLLRASSDGQDRLDIAEAAATFLLEVLAAFEMTQRGFLERTRASRGARS